jgi:hypothetical protein
VELKKKRYGKAAVIEGDTLAEWEAGTKPCEGVQQEQREIIW